jgi:demethylmenaquinone methyltransferase / 2-methoxy-6-polyprenyl-1,4-benzoquinol methylase
MRTVAASQPAPSGDSQQAGTLREGQVRAMSDRIAGVYDRMNALMTAGLDQRWRRRAADLAQASPGGRVLDVATGTGDLALELARRVAPGGRVVGTDFSDAMLARARAKAAAAAVPDVGLEFEWGNALSLPYETSSFDAATVGFGARNFADLRRGVAEMARVVRPGGQVVILEITAPQKRPLSWFYSLWFDRLVPAFGRIAGDASAYRYLPDSVKRFPDPSALAATMAGCGLRRVRWRLTAGGIIAIHSGEVAA